MIRVRSTVSVLTLEMTLKSQLVVPQSQISRRHPLMTLISIILFPISPLDLHQLFTFSICWTPLYDRLIYFEDVTAVLQVPSAVLCVVLGSWPFDWAQGLIARALEVY